MYVNHPSDMEFFDFDDFCDSNHDNLKSLYKEIENIIPGSIKNNEINEERACILTVSVFSNIMTFENFDGRPVEIDYSLLDNNQQCEEFFNNAICFCVLLGMESGGTVERNKGKWKLTSLGLEHSKQILKMRNIPKKLL